MTKFKIADVVFDIDLHFNRTRELLKDYIYEGELKPEFTIKITKEDAEEERKLTTNGENYSGCYYENVLILKGFCDYFLEKKLGIIFHSSAVMVDGRAYMFTAPSGTGKSTHAGLWRELLKDKVTMINDDKPIVKFIDEKPFVFGTPWRGKHDLGSNISAPIKAICEIVQSDVNRIERVKKESFIPVILNQTIRPEDKQKMLNLIMLTDKLLGSVETFRLYCNKEIDAAKVAYEAMVKGEINEN